MKNTKYRLVYVFFSLILFGCSDKSEQAKKDVKADDKMPRSTLSTSTRPGVSQPAPIQANQQQPISSLPTRSELRVLTEQTKDAEAEVKDIINEFDANLADKQMRKQTEAKFKKMLPEYKEKMLLIGKAKLKEGKE